MAQPKMTEQPTLEWLSPMCWVSRKDGVRSLWFLYAGAMKAFIKICLNIITNIAWKILRLSSNCQHCFTNSPKTEFILQASKYVASTCEGLASLRRDFQTFIKTAQNLPSDRVFFPFQRNKLDTPKDTDELCEDERLLSVEEYLKVIGGCHLVQ